MCIGPNQDPYAYLKNMHMHLYVNVMHMHVIYLALPGPVVSIPLFPTHAIASRESFLGAVSPKYSASVLAFTRNSPPGIFVLDACINW